MAILFLIFLPCTVLYLTSVSIVVQKALIAVSFLVMGISTLVNLFYVCGFFQLKRQRNVPKTLQWYIEHCVVISLYAVIALVFAIRFDRFI